LAACKLDYTSSARVSRFLKKARPTFPHLANDLRKLVQEVESDYENACNATRLRMPGNPDLQGKVWKYDLPSSDLRKNPRDCLRLICLIEDPIAKVPLLRAIYCDFRKNIESGITHKLVKEWAKSLRSFADDDSEEEDDEEEDDESEAV